MNFFMGGYMKAIIFDLDDTLIKWKDEYISFLKDVLLEMNYHFSDELINKINWCIDDNEKHHDILSKEELLDYINTNCNINLPIEFINILVERHKECVYEDKELIDVIDYLSKKYDLYVITNYFTDTQKERLNRMGVLKYFKNIYGADINYIKPNKKAFNIILDKYNASDCISIGDSLNNDIIPALELGMNAIWKTNSKSSEYKTFNELKELKEIL